MPPLLEARNIRKVYHGGGQLFGGEVSETVACNDFSLSIDADNPTFTTIAGESGSAADAQADASKSFEPKGSLAADPHVALAREVVDDVKATHGTGAEDGAHLRGPSL